ncbi:hypothetical protein C823_003723 [Eubacterium plexicaudatum ASF492]|nr:hypothetical protein C823_003723 [Eubacterium plexicaudatum ASF492]
MNRLDELHGLLSENVAKVGDLLRKEDESEKKKAKRYGFLQHLALLS